MRLAAQVEPLEEVIDVMAERLRDQHILRLKDGVCSIDTGVVFLDVLNNAERISDHCYNVAAPPRTTCWNTRSAARPTLFRWKKWKPEPE